MFEAGEGVAPRPAARSPTRCSCSGRSPYGSFAAWVGYGAERRFTLYMLRRARYGSGGRRLGFFGLPDQHGAVANCASQRVPLKAGFAEMDHADEKIRFALMTGRAAGR